MNTNIFQRLFSGLIITIVIFVMTSLTYAKENTPDNTTINAPEGTVTQPLPLRLSPLWWDAFGKSRGQELIKQIEQLKYELDLAQSPEEAVVLRSQIFVLLDKYVEKHDEKPFIDLTSRPLKESYNLNDVEAMVKDHDLLESDISLLQVINKEEQEKIEKRDAQLTAIKLVYLKDDDQDSKKLLQGLNWIKAQFEIAILSINKRTLEAEIKAKEKMFSAFKEQKSIAISRFTVDQSLLATAKANLAILTKKIEKAQRLLGNLDNQNDFFVQEGNEKNIDRQLLLLKIFNARTQLKYYQAWRQQEQLILDISKLNQENTSAYRQQLSANLDKILLFLKEERNWFNSVEDRVSKERKATQKAIEASKDNITQRKIILKREKVIDEIYKTRTKLEAKLSNLDLLTSILAAQLARDSAGVEAAYKKASKVVHSSWQGLRSWMGASLFSINGVPVTPFGLLNFLVIILFGWILSKLVFYSLKKVSARTGSGGIRPSSIHTLSRIISFVFLGIALLIGFSSLGIDVTKLTLFASALSIGIGFGLQNIINNFVSGVILMFERSMKVGDYIELANGVRGEVQEINIRSTVISTNDEIDIIVPNSEFVNSNVTNWTMRSKFLRLKVPFSVAYQSDIVLVRKAVTEAALELPYTLNDTDEQYPQVRLFNFAESGLDFELVIWVKPQWVMRLGRVKSGYNWAIKETLSENNINIPFPQREVRIIEDKK